MSMIRNLRRTVRRAYRRTVDLSHPARSPLGSAVVNCVVYRDGERQLDHCAAEEALRRVRRAGTGFVWIGLHEPDREEFTGVAELFGLHRLAVEDAVTAHHRPKAELYDETLFAVFKTVSYIEHEELTATSEVVDTGELMVFAGADFVITVRHGRHGSLGPLREHLEASPEQLAKGPAAVLHAIADHMVDEYLGVADAIQDDIDAVETGVFSGQAARGEAGRIYQLKRELLELKRAVAPLDRPLRKLATEPGRPGGYGDPEVLQGRLGPPGAGHRADSRLRRSARLHPPGPPRAGDRRPERGHAQDHGVGRDHRRTDHGLRGLRHELRAHARVAVDVRLPPRRRRDRRRLLRRPPPVPAQRLALRGPSR